MKISNNAQGSAEWLKDRAGIPSASELDAIISPLGKVRDSKGVESYLAKKLAEKWLGEPLEDFGSWQMEQGTIVEERARRWLPLFLNRDIQQVGFITNDAGTVGCSPDGVIDNEIGVELKCPQSQAHVQYLLKNKLPPDYIAQVQCGLYVTGFKEWLFVSYHTKFPKLVLHIGPDEEFHEALEDALNSFNERLAEAFERLCEVNGGPPPKREPMVFVEDMQGRDDQIGITP